MRTAHRHLAPWLARHAHSSSDAGAVVKSAAKIAKAETGGMLSWLTGSSDRITTPLDEPLKDVVIMRPDAVPAQAPQLETSPVAGGPCTCSSCVGLRLPHYGGKLINFLFASPRSSAALLKLFSCVPARFNGALLYPL